MRLSGPTHASATLPPEKNTGTRQIGGWVGPTASMNGSGEGKICCTCQDSKPDPSSAQLTKNVTFRCQFILFVSLVLCHCISIKNNNFTYQITKLFVQIVAG
jgi:hypothetical protein